MPPPRVIVLALALTACSADERPQLLGEMPAYEGGVRIESRSGSAVRVLEGELTFDRASGYVRFVRTAGGALLRPENGAPLRRIEGQEESIPSLLDEGDFTLLMVVLTGRPDERARVDATDGGYAVTQGDTELRVLLTPRDSRGR